MEEKSPWDGIEKSASEASRARSWGGGRRAEPGDMKYLPGPGAPCLGKFSSWAFLVSFEGAVYWPYNLKALRITHVNVSCHTSSALLSSSSFFSKRFLMLSFLISDNTASTIGTIMAVVAVLLIHMERNAVVSMKPSIKLQRTMDQSNQLNLYLLVTLYRTEAVIISCLPSIAFVESRIWENLQVVSGIPLTIGIRKPSSTDKDWNPVPGIRNPPRGIQNPRLSWIRLHGARTSSYCFKRFAQVNFT